MTTTLLIETTVSLTIQVASIVLLAELLTQGTRSERTRDRIWTSTLVVLLSLPIADLLFPHLRMAPLRVGLDEFSMPGVATRAMIGFALVWAAGAAFLVLRLAAGVFWMARAFRRARPLTVQETQRIVSAFSANLAELRLQGREVRILASGEVWSPSCGQLQSPRILLPESVLQFPAEEQALIVQHELAHLRCGHPVRLFVQRLVEAMLWPHPLVWWIGRRAERCRELVCDDEAVTSRKSAATYLRAILRMVSAPAQRTPLFLGFRPQRALIALRAERLAHSSWEGPPLPTGGWLPALPFVAGLLAMLLLWIPAGSAISRRSAWSPWPSWSASLLHSLGVPARDYEVDGHRLLPQERRRGEPEPQ